MSSLSHIDSNGNPTMVDVGQKQITERVAKAKAELILTDEIMALLSDDDIKTKKGPVFQTAILAGIQAAKKTSDLIPLCHPLALNSVDIKITAQENNKILILATAKVSGKTGVEMEALTAASVAALTIYDMCKALSHNIIIQNVMLVHKSGGKSTFNRDENE